MFQLYNWTISNNKGSLPMFELAVAVEFFSFWQHDLNVEEALTNTMLRCFSILGFSNLFI